MSNQIELRHLRYFLAVAEDLHFRKAAEKLFISQPGLSRQIKLLETELGVQLFDRHNRKVVLTKAGFFFKSKMQDHMNQIALSIKQTQQISKGDFGNLKFGYVGSAMQDIIPKLLLRFQKEHPEVHFNLQELGNDEQIKGLLRNDLDIGFVRIEDAIKGFETKEVVSEPFCLVLPINHPIDENTFKSVAQFKKESFILFDKKYSISYYNKVMQIFIDHGFTPVVSHNTIHASSIFKLVENNFGISIIPKSLCLEQHKKIKFIELDRLPQRTVLSAIWHKNNNNPTLKRLLTYL